MTDKLKQIIKDEVALLPKDMQNAVSSLDWPKVAEDIGRKYLLSDDEINDLEVETLLILLGYEDGDAYPRNIENEVGTSKNEAENIAKEAIEKIFTPIYNALAENIKKNMKSTDAKLEQNLDFIMSGGNYGTLVENTDNETPVMGQARPIGTSSMQDVKDKLIN